MTTTTPTHAGRGWAYTGAILGGLVSIAANVAHSFLPPPGVPTTWHPESGAVIGAIVWPVFLFIAVEILARTRWPHGLGWSILRFGGLLPVALVAAFVSYRHLSGLLAHYGEEAIIYYTGPLAVDGLMIMATGALIASARITVNRTSAAAAPTTAVRAASPLVERTTTPVPAGQLARARHLALAHRKETGTPITAGKLAARLRINSAVAAQILAVLNLDPTGPTTPVSAVNGAVVKATTR